MKVEVNEIAVILNKKQCEKLIKEISTLDRGKFDILLDLGDYIKGGFK